MLRQTGLIKREGGVKAPNVMFAVLTNDIRECFKRVNICNRSQLLKDNAGLLFWMPLCCLVTSLYFAINVSLIVLTVIKLKLL